MAFALVLVFLGVYAALGMVTRKYTKGTRLALITMAVMLPLYYYFIWR